MSQNTARLTQLRWLFVVYFAAQLIVDIVLGWDLTRAALRDGHGFWLGHLRLSHGGFLTLIFLGAGVLFALGLWLFHELLRKKNWARVVLLIVGWLTVIDALLGFLITSRATGFTPWLRDVVPGLDWQRALLVDRIKDFLGLIFWGYLIYILQVKSEVKRDFFPPPQASGPGKTGPTGTDA
jgi:hypothetical protein